MFHFKSRVVLRIVPEMPRMCLFTRQEHNMSLTGVFVSKCNSQIYVKQTTDGPTVITGTAVINKRG